MKAVVKTRKKAQGTCVKERMGHVRELAMFLLDWDEETYGSFVFEMAQSYLDYHIGADVYGIQMLMRSHTFWAWWKNQWMRRDEEFLMRWGDVDNTIECRAEYEFIHSAINLHMRPNRVIMDSSYMHMAQQVMDAERGLNHAQ